MGLSLILNRSTVWPADGSRELLTNSGFEGVYSQLAPSWQENTWGQDQYKHVSWGCEKQSARNGVAQQIAVSQLAAGCGTMVFQPFTFPPGRVFEGRL